MKWLWIEERKEGNRAAVSGGKIEAFGGWKETAKYICESGSKEGWNHGGTVQLLSRGRDALAVVSEERGGACPGAVDQ